MSGAAGTRLTVIDYEPIPGITDAQAQAARACIARHASGSQDAQELADMVLAAPRQFHGKEGRHPRQRGNALKEET